MLDAYDEGGCWAQRLEAHPGTEEVGTVWGFGDLSGEIHTHWSVSFLSD